MLLTVKTIAIGSDALTTKGLQIAYSLKPTRQSWDFADEDFKSTNISIDTVKFSCPKDEALIAGKVVGDELEITLGNDVETVSGTFVIRDIAIKDGYAIVVLMVSGELTEAKAA